MIHLNSDKHDRSVNEWGLLNQSSTIGAVSRDEAGMALTMTAATANLIDIALCGVMMANVLCTNGLMPQIETPKAGARARTIFKRMQFHHASY